SRPPSTVSSVNPCDGWPASIMTGPVGVRSSGPQLVAEPGVLEEQPGRTLIFLRDEHPPRQDSDRSLKHAHVLIGDDMRDAGALEQRLDGADQDAVVGADDLPHVSCSRAALSLHLSFESYCVNLSLAVDHRHVTSFAAFCAR